MLQIQIHPPSYSSNDNWKTPAKFVGMNCDRIRTTTEDLRSFMKDRQVAIALVREPFFVHSKNIRLAGVDNNVQAITKEIPGNVNRTCIYYNADITNPPILVPELSNKYQTVATWKHGDSTVVPVPFYSFAKYNHRPFKEYWRNKWI